MRKIIAAALILFASSPAYAGSYALNDQGQLSWKSGCLLTPPPESLVAANSETSGEDMNKRATEYNAYVQQAQDYMNCVSAEAEKDAAAAGQAVVSSGQGLIDKTQADLQKLKPSSNGQKQ